MITERTLSPIFTDIDPNYKTVSIALDTIIEKDGVELAKSRHRCAFVPGEIDKVREYTGLSDDAPEIIYLKAIWTEEVINQYKASIGQ